MIYRIYKNQKRIAYIYFHTNNNNNGGILTILSLFVLLKYRGKGYGSKLLKKVINFAKINGNIYYIELDDITSEYRNINNNIYIKHGFEYKYDTGPEMVFKINNK